MTGAGVGKIVELNGGARKKRGCGETTLLTRGPGPVLLTCCGQSRSRRARRPLGGSSGEAPRSRAFRSPNSPRAEESFPMKRFVLGDCVRWASRIIHNNRHFTLAN